MITLFPLVYKLQSCMEKFCCERDNIATTLIIVYQVRKRFSDGRGAARVDKDGDLNVSFPKPPGQTGSTVSAFFKKSKEDDVVEDDVDGLLDDHDQGADASEDRNEAWRFLLAGGVAGAGESWRDLIWLNGVERQSWKGDFGWYTSMAS